MDIGNNIEKINNIEEKINLSINLLEISQTYCESNFDKAKELVTIYSVIEIILNEQKKLINCLDDIAMI